MSGILEPLVLETLATLYPEQLWLESPRVEQTSRREQEYSYDVARRTAFKNRLTLDAFEDWFRTESGLEEQLQVWPSREDLPNIWEIVNGTAIQLGVTRIVLVPSEEMDTNEFCVSAEWVDIPSWAADYYLAVQVNADAGWLRVWGYTTHKKLKQAGRQNEIAYTYSLERENLIEDLNVMWVARKLGRDEKAAVAPLQISPEEAETLLGQLSQQCSYSPRLKIGFAQWGALIENATWRRRLYQMRIATAESISWVNLSQWFQNVFEEGWQAVENVFAPTNLIPVLGVGSPEREREPNSKAIASIIPLLQPHQDELLRRQAAGVLAKIGVGNKDVSIALTELLHTARDEKTRWQAAISLGKVDPGNPEAGRQRAKLVDLGMQLEGHAVALIMAVMPRSDGKFGVFLQVQPTNVRSVI